MLRFFLYGFLFFLVLRMIRQWKGQAFATSVRQKPLQSKTSSTIDKIVPCPTCGTYNPSQIAYQAGKNFYCNTDCYRKKENG